MKSGTGAGNVGSGESRGEDPIFAEDVSRDIAAQDAGASRPGAANGAGRRNGNGQSVPLLGRDVPLPQSRPQRIAIGGLLVLLGTFGFLPVLGFWMIPLGLLLLSYELPTVRRWRRRTVVWWHGRKGRRR